MNRNKIKVLFVCHGNICRSPAAQGTFEKLILDRKLNEYFIVDSAGTSSYHIGEEPHPLTKKAALEFGIKLNHIARQFTKEDEKEFDYIFAMDRYNLQDIRRITENSNYQKKIFLFREFDPEINNNQIPDVPDPYYGGYNGFLEVQKIILRTSENLLNYLLEKELKLIK